MRKIKQSIRYYKMLLVEIIETLCTICLYLESEGRHTHNQYGQYMRGHFNVLKEFSTEMRLSLYDADREVEYMKKPYVVSEKNGAYYCHKRGFPYIPVFGSIGDKRKADKVCKMMNESVGK